MMNNGVNNLLFIESIKMKFKILLNKSVCFFYAVFIASILIGCASNDIKIIYNQDNNPSSFDGLVNIINTSNSDVNIMFLHGMDGYASRDNRVDPCFVIDNLRKAYGLEPANNPFPQLFCNNTFSVGNKNVQLTSLHWNDLTSLRKSDLASIDNDPNLAENRAGMTKIIRQELINDGFSDALMYTGVYRKPIINRVINNLKKMNDAQPDAINIFITFSLGSSILVDTIKELEKRNELKLLKNKVEMVYMLANQIPLINLGTQEINTLFKVKSTTPSQYSQLEKVLNIPVNLEKSEDPKIRVVAFTDPNDLLSYPLDPDSMGNLKNMYVNAAVSIAKKTYYLPFFKQYGVVNYLEAHTGYVHNPTVNNLLLYGYGNSLKDKITVSNDFN